MSKIIEIIQGESVAYMLTTISPEEREYISSITFCSTRLGIHKEIGWSEDIGAFVLSFTPQETSVLPSCRADYTITIRFIDNNVRIPTLSGDMFVRENTCGHIGY